SDTTTCLRFVSTDVTRLNIMECLYEGNDAIPVGKNVLVSKKGLGDAIKFLDTDGDVQIGIKENAFIIRKASETLMLQLLEGEFPKYQNILEKRDSARIEMEKIPFSKLLKRMSIIATEKYNSAMFTFDNNTLTVSAVNPEYGESKEEMEISFSGAPVTAAFNPKFFIDTLNLLDHETVIVDIVDGNSACILKNDADPTFTSIIMPMRF
ncbi:DNA polymerase III subunit beta, partial [Desulfosarcina sp. OttesenSCG-928-G10]|nr:DNA polymerase III subunit beta [Desulfosarcina sp. OttesenSCG-928-G10]